MITIGVEYLVTFLSGMLVMTCLGWGIGFLFGQRMTCEIHPEHCVKHPLRKAAGLLALSLSLGYTITTCFQFPGDWMSALACHLVAVDMLSLPLAAITMVLVIEHSRVTIARVLFNVLPFVFLCPLCMWIHQMWYITLVALLAGGYMVAMLIYILIQGLRYEKRIRDEYSNLAEQSIMWVVTSLVFVLLILINTLIFVNDHSIVLRMIHIAVTLLTWNLIFYRLSIIILHREIGVYRQIDELIAEDPDKDTTPLLSEDVDTFTRNLDEVCLQGQLYLQENIKRDDLARKLGMSHTTFTKLLKLSHGLSFYEYINLLRVNKATEMINAGNTDVGLICQQVGYRYRSTFNRAFMAVNKCSPTEYINQQKRAL